MDAKITLSADDKTKEAFDSVNRKFGELKDKSAQSAQAMNGAFAGLSASTRYAFQNASYQISDFIVQVQGGTAASRALGQQLPQLLAGFGAFGAAAGVIAGFAPQIIELFKSDNEVKPLADALKDLDGALSGVAAASMSFDMTSLYKEFNKTESAARGSIVSLLEYKKTLTDFTSGMTETSLAKDLKEIASLGTLDRLIGGDKAVDVAKRFGIEIGIARDLLADARGGVSESTILAERYATVLAKGSDKGRELAAAMVAAAKGSRDAAAAQTAISEAMVKIRKAGATGTIPLNDKSERSEKGETSKASNEAVAYAKSMEALANMTRDADAAQLDLSKSQKAFYDLMVAPEWKNMPDSWKQTAVAQFDQAYAAEQAADATKRLNELLGKTESAGIEKARADMQLLTKALEEGIITEEKYLEATKARLEGSSKQAADTLSAMDEFAKSAAHNMESALADLFINPTKTGIGGLASSFSQTLQKMIAEAGSAQLMKSLLGNMGQASGGQAGNWGWVGQAATWAAAFFEDGGIMTDKGPLPLRKYATGGIANSPQLAMFGEGRMPEAYVPLPDGRNIPVKVQGSTSDRPIVINVNSQTGDTAQIRRSAAAGARAALGAVSSAQRYA